LSYQTANLRSTRAEAITLHSGTVTANGNGAARELGDKGTARLLLDVTAVSGTSPTLNVTVETSFDGATWRTVGTFAQKTAVSQERKSFPGLDRFVRISRTTGGTTPSFTFEVSGDAV
jgi:hypothetical protein